MLQASVFDGLPFDPFALLDDGVSPAEVGVGGRHIAEAFVISAVIIVVDEGLDPGLQIAGQEVIFQQDRYALAERCGGPEPKRPTPLPISSGRGAAFRFSACDGACRSAR